MRSSERTPRHVSPQRPPLLDPAATRAIVVMSMSVLVIGIAYGVAGHDAGLAWWHLAIIGAVVLAGSSELVFVAVLATGGLPILGAIAGLLINTRNLGYGLSIGPHLDSGPGSFARAHLINDETAALTTGRPATQQTRRAFLVCGVAILACWPAGAVLGALAGSVISKPDAWGLDAAMPALLLALAMPALRHRRTLVAAVIGVGAALAATPYLPAGLPVLVALVGVLVTCRGVSSARPA